MRSSVRLSKKAERTRLLLAFAGALVGALIGAFGSFGTSSAAQPILLAVLGAVLAIGLHHVAHRRARTAGKQPEHLANS